MYVRNGGYSIYDCFVEPGTHPNMTDEPHFTIEHEHSFFSLHFLHSYRTHAHTYITIIIQETITTSISNAFNNNNNKQMMNAEKKNVWAQSSCHHNVFHQLVNARISYIFLLLILHLRLLFSFSSSSSSVLLFSLWFSLALAYTRSFIGVLANSRNVSFVWKLLPVRSTPIFGYS